MGKKFKATLTQTIYVEFQGEEATEVSAAYVVENMARCYHRKGMSKNLSGAFYINGDEDAKASNVQEIVNNPNGRG